MELQRRRTEFPLRTALLLIALGWLVLLAVAGGYALRAVTSATPAAPAAITAVQAKAQPAPSADSPCTWVNSRKEIGRAHV